jgi:hypothetical protein
MFRAQHSHPGTAQHCLQRVGGERVLGLGHLDETFDSGLPSMAEGP